MAYKAEYQVVEITQEQWNKIGQKLGITGLAAKRKAVNGNEQKNIKNKAQ